MTFIVPTRGDDPVFLATWARTATTYPLPLSIASSPLWVVIGPVEYPPGGETNHDPWGVDADRPRSRLVMT